MFLRTCLYFLDPSDIWREDREEDQIKELKWNQIEIENEVEKTY